MDIFEAAGRWGTELVDALGAGADPNARDENGRTPLFRAAKAGEAQVQLLLEAGADPNARDNQGFAPLHFAASAGGHTVAALVRGGPRVDAADANGHTPLLHAIHQGWREAASALHHAAQRGAHLAGAVETVRDLLKGGLAVDAADAAGWRPLMLATDRAILRELLKAGARPELDEAEVRLLGRSSALQTAAIRAAQG